MSLGRCGGESELKGNQCGGRDSGQLTHEAVLVEWGAGRRDREDRLGRD